MSDEIDMACDSEQRDRDLAISVARLQATPVVVWHTNCKYCGDPTEEGKQFCSYGQDSCATEHGWYQRTLQRTGVSR